MLCVVFFSIMYANMSSSNDRGLNLVLGWIGWLAMMTVVVPNMVSPETRGEWFSKEYSVGTLVLLLLNVFGVIGASALAYNIIT